MGGVCYTSDVVWTVRRAPAMLVPAPPDAGCSEYVTAPVIPVFSISYELPSSPHQSPPPPLQWPPPPLQSPPPPLQPLPPPPPLQPPPPHPSLHPYLEPQRISGRTSSKKVQVTATPNDQCSATLKEPPPSSPVNHDHGLPHSVGLRLMRGRTDMLSMLDTREAVDARRRVLGRGQLSSSVRNRKKL